MRTSGCHLLASHFFSTGDAGTKYTGTLTDPTLTNPLATPFATYCVVTGSLTFYSDAALTFLTQGALSFLGQDLTFPATQTQLADIEFPALAFIGGTVTVDTSDSSMPDSWLTFIGFASLTYIGGGFAVVSNSLVNTALTSVYLPVLSHVASDLDIQHSNALTTISLPQLTFIGGALEFYENALLTIIELPLLTFAASNLNIFLNNALTRFTLPVLTFIGGGLRVTDSAALTYATFPELVSIAGSETTKTLPTTQFAVQACSNSAGFTTVRDFKPLTKTNKKCAVSSNCVAYVTCH